MKLILIVLALVRISSAFSTSTPGVFAIAQDTYTITSAVSNAVFKAVENVTLWTGGDRVHDRFRLLIELETFELDLERSMTEITESFLNGTFANEYRPILSRLNSLLQTHMDNLNIQTTILIPAIENLTGTYAITSCLNLIQVTRNAIEKLSIHISS